MTGNYDEFPSIAVPPPHQHDYRSCWEAIAAECGYPDPYYFSNRFKKRFGRPPRACRG
jgi:YesN/AraC family two-component response regulator